LDHITATNQAVDIIDNVYYKARYYLSTTVYDTKIDYYSFT